MWDAIGTEFGGRHEPRVSATTSAITRASASRRCSIADDDRGDAARYKGFAEQCRGRS